MNQAKKLIEEKNEIDEDYPVQMKRLRQIEQTMEEKQQNIADMEQTYREIIGIQSDFEEIANKHYKQLKDKEDEEEIERQLHNVKEESEDGDFDIPEKTDTQQ